MELLRLFCTLLLPWSMGVVCLCWGWRRPPQGAWAMVLGYGFLLGLLATTGIMFLMDVLGLSQRFFTIALILGSLTVVGVWRSGKTVWIDLVKVPETERVERESSWHDVLVVILLALILMRFISLALEIYWRPLYPWDAWKVWAVKSQVWFELKHLVPFVDGMTWMRHPGAFYTVEGWHYPETVSLISTWLALGLGRWDGALVNLPWLFCWTALGLAFYGQARICGVSFLKALVFTYLLLSMPLLNTHVALAGYADLWLAAVYSLAGMAFFQWQRTGQSRQGILALVLALACVTVKVEGMVWMLTFLPALIVTRLSKKIVVALFALGLALLLLWLSLGGFVVQVPELGQVALTPELIKIPYLGQFSLGLTLHWEPFINNFFIFDNWHLFWFLVLVTMLIGIPYSVRESSLVALSVLIVSGFMFLFFLFFVTSASAWAADYTALNRLFMHMVPVLLFYLLVLLQGRRLRSGSETVSEATT